MQSFIPARFGHLSFLKSSTDKCGVSMCHASQIQFFLIQPLNNFCLHGKKLPHTNVSWIFFCISETSHHMGYFQKLKFWTSTTRLPREGARQSSYPVYSLSDNDAPPGIKDISFKSSPALKAGVLDQHVYSKDQRALLMYKHQLSKCRIPVFPYRFHSPLFLIGFIGYIQATFDNQSFIFIHLWYKNQFKSLI